MINIWYPISYEPDINTVLKRIDKRILNNIYNYLRNTPNSQILKIVMKYSNELLHTLFVLLVGIKLRRFNFHERVMNAVKFLHTVHKFTTKAQYVTLIKI